MNATIIECFNPPSNFWGEEAKIQKATDVGKKDVWDFQAPSQTFWNCDFPRKRRRRRQEPALPDLAWNSQTLPDIRDHPSSSETGIGRVKTYRTLEGGGGLAPKVVLAKLGLFDPQMKFFSVETL